MKSKASWPWYTSFAETQMLLPECRFICEGLYGVETLKREPLIHYHVDNSPPPVPVLSQIHLVHSTASIFLKPF